MGVSVTAVEGTGAGVPTKAPRWETLETEFLGFPPADHAPVPVHILKGIWAFDPVALPVWIRRAYKDPNGKLTVRVFNGLAYQSFLPSQQGKEPIVLQRPVGPFRWNGPVYDDRVFEWYPRNVLRRDLPGVFLPWDNVRLIELRAAYWRLYGRLNGAEKTDAESLGQYVSREDQLKAVSADARLRLEDVAGPFQNPYVGYTGREFLGH